MCVYMVELAEPQSNMWRPRDYGEVSAILQMSLYLVLIMEWWSSGRRSEKKVSLQASLRSENSETYPET